MRDRPWAFSHFNLNTVHTASSFIFQFRAFRFLSPVYPCFQNPSVSQICGVLKMILRSAHVGYVKFIFWQDFPVRKANY